MEPRIDFSSLDPAYIANSPNFDQNHKSARKDLIVQCAGSALLITLLIIVINTPYSGFGFFIIFLEVFWVYFYYSDKSDKRNKLAFKEFLKSNSLKEITPKQAITRGELFTPPALRNIGHDRKINFGFTTTIQKYETSYCQIEFTTGSGKSSRDYKFSCLSFDTPAMLEHFLLDARNNELMPWFSNIPRHYEQGQRLSLEGDFDKYFDLYVAAGTHIDVLSVLGPDVMQMLISQSRLFDLESEKQRVFLFCSGHTIFNPELMAGLFRAKEEISKQLKRHKGRIQLSQVQADSKPALKSRIGTTFRIGQYRVNLVLFIATLIIASFAVSLVTLLFPFLHQNSLAQAIESVIPWAAALIVTYYNGKRI